MNNQFNLNFSTDLGRGISLTTLKMAFLEDDKKAHVFTVKTTKNGEDNSLSGASVKGYFINLEEDVTVEITGSVNEDGNAEVAFSDACYSFVGRFYFVIRATIDGVESSIFYSEGAVLRTHTGKVSNTSPTAPSLSALEERINNLTFSEVGAAPSGYGLGEIAWNLPILDDAHNALKTGWYRMTANTINGIGHNAICHSESLDANVRILTAFTTQASNLYYVIRQKVCFNGVWKDWAWPNPPFILGTEYLTTERYLGKEVYAKLVNFGALPSATTKAVSFTDARATAVVYCSLHLSDGGFIVGAGADLNVSTTTITVHTSLTSVSVNTTVDLSDVTAYALVKYTKD